MSEPQRRRLRTPFESVRAAASAVAFLLAVVFCTGLSGQEQRPSPAPKPAVADTAPFATVDRFREAGMNAEALAALKAAIKAHPSTPVPYQLRDLGGGGPWGWLRVVFGWLGLNGPALLLVVVPVLAVLRFAASRLLKPLLKIPPFENRADAELGKEFVSVVESAMKSLASGYRGRDVQLVTGPVEKIALPAAVVASIPGSVSWLAAIPAFLQWLSPRRDVTLAGRLLAPDADGAGVVLSLVFRGRVQAGITLREGDFRPLRSRLEAADGRGFERLAEIVAVWTLYNVSRLSRTPFTPLGTRHWRSYALFSAGVYLEREQRWEDARSTYYAALQRDAGNAGARLNLAGLLLRDLRGAPSPAEMAATLEIALKHLDRAAATVDRRSPVRYRSLYSRAVTQFDAGSFPAAYDTARTLVEDIAVANADPATPDDVNLCEFLEWLETAARLMYVGTRIKMGYPVTAQLLELEPHFDDPVSQVQYNLACMLSGLLEHPELAPEGPAQVSRDCLKHLAYAFRLDRQTIDAAETDPSLAAIRADARFGPLVLRFRAQAAPGAADLPLAGCELIGEPHAGALAAVGIHTPADLLVAAVSPAQRARLAAGLNVSAGLVERWASAVDLMRIDGIGHTQVNLLARAGVDCRDALSRWDPAELFQDLKAAAGASPGAPQTAAVVQTWIAEAGAVPGLVHRRPRIAVAAPAPAASPTPASPAAAWRSGTPRRGRRT